MSTGARYADSIAAYIHKNFGEREVEVYREISIGKSIIGKNRRVDVLVHDPAQRIGLALECKFQQAKGTADEKIPYTLRDVGAMWMPACVVYAGEGFSEGVLHMLRGSELAAYCSPSVPELTRTTQTRELDHILAQHFHWWDVLLGGKSPIHWSDLV